MYFNVDRIARIIILLMQFWMMAGIKYDSFV